MNPPPKPSDKGQRPVVPTLLAVVGSVAGALVSKALDSSQSLALLGAGLGAAIPPLVAVKGRRSHLRLAGGVLIAALALVFTYAGFTVSEKALGKADTTFPVPGSGLAAKTTSAGATCEGQLCIRWSPRDLDCSSDLCEPDVTVRSEGDKELRVTGLLFTGQAKSRYSPGRTCNGARLQKGEECSITVHVDQGKAAGPAQLRIQQNLKGPASIVTLKVDASPTPPAADLELSLDPDDQCTVTPDGNLTIPLAVGNSELSDPVPLILTSDTMSGGRGTAGFKPQRQCAGQLEPG